MGNFGEQNGAAIERKLALKRQTKIICKKALNLKSFPLNFGVYRKTS